MKRKILKYGLIIVGVAIVIGGGTVLYLFNMPHRDVQAAESDFELSAADLVKEYLADGNIANEKYLQEEGESKILAVNGKISEISKNLADNYVVVLQDKSSPAGVRCTFMIETNSNASALKLGQEITVKGVIRSGAAFDSDLDLYEDVILEKCDII